MLDFVHTHNFDTYSVGGNKIIIRKSWLRHNQGNLAVALMIVLILGVIAYQVVSVLSKTKQGEGTIIGVDNFHKYGAVTVSVLTDDNISVYLYFDVSDRKEPLVGEHIRFSCYGNELIDFWYDNEEVFYET